eukprot:TRINITY_DN27318_c0_g1_i1.p1 TRINITY_DN27318_c0_g1~~TRINITY_DN27318_c0_g1_i1.p1  ORF type:complete len:242 (+),score=78.07 TRINITY_DN27318_c0_g1_i1:245-970(+)
MRLADVCMSTIMSKWFGEGEKFVRALSTLASKLAPCVVFVDEIDSVLSRRSNETHEAMRKIKNEFMTNLDGLRTREGERVLILAATNRPFDLDEAVLRRLPRRMLVDLPTADQRAKILRLMLAKEQLEPSFDYQALALKTDTFSGSDLKNLCVAAAYQPIREFLANEQKESTVAAAAPGKSAVRPVEVALRPIRMADFEKALTEISASVSEDATSIMELRKWNEQFGDGGSRSKTTLPYFL